MGVTALLTPSCATTIIRSYSSSKAPIARMVKGVYENDQQGVARWLQPKKNFSVGNGKYTKIGQFTKIAVVGECVHLKYLIQPILQHRQIHKKYFCTQF